MAEENKNLQNEDAADATPVKAEKKSKKADEKKPNVFVRFWKWLKKLCKDLVGELKKVVWTPKDELKKNTILVIATVVAVGVTIALVDTVSSLIINSIAGLIG